ncbi:MAG: glucose/galactose MFS transporter [Flavobacteriales bacterium]|nr:glucose/galactose MFS transporter [Flavobacteriales bacterium]|tara:strand:+ start:9508 stop:10809 length:1302 start_codon:yes stop_codon:yes gene_type:complete
MAKNKYLFPFIALTSLFFLWGFLTVLVDFLIPRLKEIFTLTYFQAGLVQFAFFMAYFLLSIPAGFILSKIGYKKGIVLGLLTMAIGCFLFYPAAEFRTFSIFLIAYFILAGGMTILQVAANPFVAVLGDPKGASSRLNLAQAFNSLGTAIAPAIGASFLLSDSIKTNTEINILSEIEKSAYYIKEAIAVQTPFIILSLSIVALAIIFTFIKLPAIMKKVSNHGYKEVLKNKILLMGAFAILVYVGAEVTIGSYLVNYFIDMDIHLIIQNTTWMNNLAVTILNADLLNLDKRAIVGAFVTFYWTGAMIGRFIGAYLTNKNNPSKILLFFSIGALILILISINTIGLISMWSILAVGLFNSIMFPTIFTLSIQNINELKPQASGILCTMIVGGAIIPPLYGLLTDLSGFKIAMLLLLACYGYIYYFAKYSSNNLS